MQKKIFGIICTMLMVISLLVGCVDKREPDEEKKFATISDFSEATIGFINGNPLEKSVSEMLDGARIGIMTGSAAVLSMKKEYPDAQIVEIDSIGNAVEMLKAGKLEYVLSSRSTCLNFAKYNDGLEVIDRQIISGDITAAYVAVSKENNKLLNNINTILNRYLEDGTMAAIEENWLGENAAYDMSGISQNADAPVLKVGMDVNDEPMDFIMDGKNAGYDCELIERIAYELGMRVEYVNMSFPSLIPALQSGKVDVVISDITATDERREMVDFSEPYYLNPQILLTRKSENATAESGVKSNDSDIEEKLAHAKIGSVTGTLLIDGIRENYPEAEIVEFNDFGNAVEALKANKVNYVITSRSLASNYARNNKELYVIDQNVLHSTDTWSYAAVRKGYDKLTEINEILNGFLEDGTMDNIVSNWIGENAAYDMSGIPVDKNAPVWKVGISADMEPTCFLNGEGEYCGVDCETAMRIAYEMGMQVEFVNMDFTALLPALQSGKVDFVIANMGYTEERAKVVDFTTHYLDDGNIVLAKKSDEAIAADTSSDENVSQNFIDKLKASFTRTFITENRWKLILSGLGVTILISLCSFVIGSLWGAVICAGLRSSRNIAKIPARIYVRLLQGTPIVVLLMILYYIVFKSFDISAVIVAVIGFSLNLGAYTCEIFRTAIDSVDKGQIEAASALGFSKFRVFTKIIFPQAARNALPVYKGEFISLVKSTSIVGYIAIQDLTKASDIIRSRTYEAFFPLITTAIIYFVVTYIFIVLLNVLEKKIDPKRRKRTLKGVDLK